jgi:DNA-binding transcriptional ArsR family regulator
MVVNDSRELDDTALTDDMIDRIFHALADATRRDIVTRVLQRPHSVSELAAGYAMSFAAVQKHVAVLEKAALVSKSRSGREQHVTGDVETIARAQRLLGDYEKLWRARAEAIDALLAAEHDARHDKHARHDN